MNTTKKRFDVSKWIVNLALSGLVAISLYPYVFMVLTSLTQKRIMSASFDFFSKDQRN